MKKALSIFLFASSLFAQVQIGKNVQIGAPGGTGGNVLPTPQYRLFIQPNTGTQAVAGPAVTGVNAVAPMLQGTINPDLYANGSGNNGIANALALPDCVTAGCFFQRSITSTDTEDIATALTGTYIHGLDSQYGVSAQYFRNVGQNAANAGSRIANSTTCFWNDQLANPSAETFCRPTFVIAANPGLYVRGNPTVVHGDEQDMYAYGRAITSMHGGTLVCYHVGDCQISYTYLHYRSGSIAGGDEAIQGDAKHLIEDDPPHGVIVTGGPNATIIQSNFTSNAGHQGDGMALVATNELMASGLVTGQTAGSGLLLNSITTSDTHAVSTGYGTLSADCGAPVARNAPVSTVCSINVISGSFSAAANSTVCVGDYQEPEQVSVSAVGIGTITLGLTFSHTSGTPIYQGGLCGGKLALAGGLNSPFDDPHYNFTSYFIAGSRTATTADYIRVFNQGQNGNMPIELPSIGPVTLQALTRTANVVTASIVGGAFAYNNYVAPPAASIVVSGATPSDLNGVVTGTHANTAGMTWSQSGADESGSGGTISVTGLNNYFIYCGAETVRVLGVTLNGNHGPTLDGTLQVEPNNCQWTPGAGVAQPNHYAQRVSQANFTVLDGFTPPTSTGNTVNDIQISGQAWAGAAENQVQTLDSLTSFVGFGGLWAPRVYLTSNDYYGTYFSFNTAPLNGGVVTGIGCPAEGCTTTAYPYKLFQLRSYGPNADMIFNPGDATFRFDQGLYDDTYLAGRTAIGIGGLAGATGAALVKPGTAGPGGYFTAVGDGVSANYDTLVLGNGDIGNSSGTLGVKTLYTPNVVAGVNPVAAFSIFQGGTAGSTTYTYACVVRTANGTTQATTATTNTGNATLSATNYNHVKCFGVPGGSTIDIYRTVGGATQGKIGTEANSAENMNIPFNDTGLAGDGTSPPTVNTTGKMVDYGVADGCATFASNVLGSTGTACGSGSGGVTSIDTLTGAFTFGGPGVSHTGNAYTFSGSGSGIGSITWAVPSWLAASPTTISASGTQTFSAATGQTANQFLATPNGTTGAVGLRVIVPADVPTLNQSTTGTAANLSGTPALPNGTTATTQTTGDNSTKLATTAFVLANAGGISGLTTGVIPKAASSTTVANSALDDGVTTANTLTYSGTGGMAAPSYATTGTVNGLFGLTAKGSAPSTLPTSTIQIEAPNTVTAYHFVLPGVIPTATGQYMTCTNANPSICSWAVPPGTGGSGIANVTTTVGTTAIAANTCASAVTVTMTGVATTSVFDFTPNADVSGVTGWGTTGGLTIVPWPTSNTLNYRVCNQTAASITPSASVVFNVGAR